MVNSTITEPALYIIMFEDVPDMNPGKGMAQASHASALFVQQMSEAPADKYYSEWIRQGCGFGTTYVVFDTGTNWSEFITDCKHLLMEEYMGTVEDFTYPYRNWYGKKFVMVIETCAYLFVTPETPQKITDYVKKLELVP